MASLTLIKVYGDHITVTAFSYINYIQYYYKLNVISIVLKISSFISLFRFKFSSIAFEILLFLDLNFRLIYCFESNSYLCVIFMTYNNPYKCIWFFVIYFVFFFSFWLPLISMKPMWWTISKRIYWLNFMFNKQNQNKIGKLNGKKMDNFQMTKIQSLNFGHQSIQHACGTSS